MASNDGTVRIGTQIDDSGFKSGLKKLGSVAKSALTGTTAVIGAASAAVGALSAKALDAYSSYEQLTGGVETLFKESANIVMEYADNAYKTAGMSANAYMETVTSFSASLLQGLGGDTAAAAEVANQAIVDMSDNANKMGTSMEMIQNAYQGFAKQNYTMLDNLKLGYGGTQAEMARLINDSGVLGDAIEVTADTVNSVSFDKIIEAIHVIQTEMGITGTTAEEASTTIEGSVNSMKAALENLITGIADDNADLDTLIDNFVSSAETAASNILPRLSQILTGMGGVVQEIAPIIAEQLPVAIESILPSLLSAGAQLVVGIAQGLISAIPSIVESIPQIAQTILASLAESAPQMAEAGQELVSMIADGITTGVPILLQSLPDLISEALRFLSGNLPSFVEKGTEFVTSLIDGIMASIPDFVASLPDLIASFFEFIANNLPQIVETGFEISRSLGDGIIKAIPEIVKSLPAIILAIVQGLISLAGSLLEAGASLIQNLIQGIQNQAKNLVDIGSKAASFVVDGLKSIGSAFIDIGRNMVEGIWKGISGAASWIADKLSNFAGGLVGTIANALGIHSPSTVFRDKIGKNIGLGVASGIEKSMPDAKSAMDKMSKDLVDAIPYAEMRISYANSAMSPSNASATQFSTENALSNAAGMLAMAHTASGNREVVFQVNGTEFARAIIPDIRSVESQSPAIKSD